MIKREVCNAHTLTTTTIDHRAILKGTKTGHNMIELENGMWLKSMGDGRYYDEQENQWAAVVDNDYDKNGELIQGCIVGYCMV